MVESLTNVRNNNEIRLAGAYPQVGGSGMFDKDITDLLGSSQYALRYELACGDLSLLYRKRKYKIRPSWSIQDTMGISD